MTDPFGRAIHDFHRGEQDEPLVQRDGEWAREHPIEAFYFGEFDEENDRSEFITSWVDGPLLDMGAGAGRDTLHFQERFETVAIEVSDHLLTTMRERGVRDARRVDMLALRETFERDRFQSAFAWGTQVGLAGSMQGLREFLDSLAFVTTPDGTVTFDCYDPERVPPDEMLGYRADSTPGLAFRVMHFEYEGDVGETLLFRLFSPERLREAASDTDWAVTEIRRDSDDSPHYQAALTKE
jgi:hypothetical protein